MKNVQTTVILYFAGVKGKSKIFYKENLED